MAALKPQGDTVRVVGWDELPPSVRDIPEGFDPLAEGVLMKHQADWVAIDAPIKGCEKGRRTGITFAEAQDDTIVAGSSKKAGGSDVFYIPDVKEKGLEFVGYCARFALVIAEAQGQGVSAIEEFLFSDQDDDGKTRQITSWRIRFASGFKIVALSSRPANIRGLQGIVVIDEAAFHDNVQAVLDAATALLIWGGKIRVISSHNGKTNPFNQFIKDIGAGLYGKKATTRCFTFDDAVANGLYERVCFMKGEVATPEGKKDWYETIRSAYGPRKAAMLEELDAIPRDGGGTCLPGVWIDRAARPELEVLRLALDDEFYSRDETDRKIWMRRWIAEHIEPRLKALDDSYPHYLAQDYARHRDFSIITLAEVSQNLRRRAKLVIEMHNVPTRQQEQLLWAMIQGTPRLGGVAIDATGSGQTLAEYTADKFGESLVHQVILNREWYRLWMDKMLKGFQDGMVEIPADLSLAQDLRAIEEIDGIPMVSKVRKQDLKDPDLYRHGDFAVSLALAWFASLQSPYQPYTYQAATLAALERDRRRGNLEEADYFGVSTTAGFKRSGVF